jgi:hypothetical protein
MPQLHELRGKKDPNTSWPAPDKPALENLRDLPSQVQAIRAACGYSEESN